MPPRRPIRVMQVSELSDGIVGRNCESISWCSASVKTLSDESKTKASRSGAVLGTLTARAIRDIE